MVGNFFTRLCAYHFWWQQWYND